MCQGFYECQALCWALQGQWAWRSRAACFPLLFPFLYWSSSLFFFFLIRRFSLLVNAAPAGLFRLGCGSGWSGWWKLWGHSGGIPGGGQSWHHYHLLIFLSVKCSHIFSIFITTLWMQVNQASGKWPAWLRIILWEAAWSRFESASFHLSLSPTVSTLLF